MYFRPVTYLISLLFFIAVATAKGQDIESQIDSLRGELRDAQDSVEFQILFRLFALNLSKDLGESERFAREALRVATEMKDTLAIIQSNNANGHVKRVLGYPRLAIPFFESGLRLARQKKIRNQTKFILNNLGLANQELSNFAKSLEYHLESLKLREEDKDTVSISVTLNNIGVVYDRLGDYENAFTYYKNNYDLIRDKVNKKNSTGYDFELYLINLAEVSNRLQRFDEAKSYLFEVLNWCESRDGCKGKRAGQIHQAMGISLLGTDDLQEAEKEFKQAEGIFTELHLPQKIESYHGLAQAKYAMGDYDGALEKLDVAQSLANAYDIPGYRLENYKLYADVYSKKKDFENSTEYQEKFIALNSKIFNADLIKNIARVQAEHQEAANLKTIAAQDQKLLSQQLSIKQQKIQFLFLGLIAALVFVAAIIFFRKERKQIRTNLELEKAKQTIEEQNKELISSNAELDLRVKARTQELHSSNESLKKVNEELDNFIYKTSHDIRGPLSSLKGITNIALKEVKDETIVSYLQKLDLTAEKLNKILTRLQIINQINHALLLPELIDFQILVDEILSAEKRKGVPPNLSLNSHIDQGIIIFSDKNILKLILENLIDNGIKFADPSNRKNPFVSIDILNQEDGVRIKVTDNGIGFKNVTPDQVFKMFIRASERSESGGIGMYLTKLSTEKLGGTIQLTNTPEDHTEFTVFLPSDLRLVIKQRDELEQRLQVEKLVLAQIQLESSTHRA